MMYIFMFKNLKILGVILVLQLVFSIHQRSHTGKVENFFKTTTKKTFPPKVPLTLRGTRRGKKSMLGGKKILLSFFIFCRF